MISTAYPAYTDDQYRVPSAALEDLIIPDCMSHCQKSEEEIDLKNVEYCHASYEYYEYGGGIGYLYIPI